MTKKDDEIELWKRMRQRDGVDPSFLTIAEDIGIPYERARHIAQKWDEDGFYDWGVSWRVGWIMDDQWCYDDGAEKKKELDALAADEYSEPATNSDP